MTCFAANGARHKIIVLKTGPSVLNSKIYVNRFLFSGIKAALQRQKPVAAT
jgi:hypothetical protein